MRPNTSIIIAAHNEEHRIAPLVQRLNAWVRTLEVIVVANGCTDKTASRARSAGARVVEYSDPLGPDVGRAIGLSVAKGDILLVIDADLDLYPWQLRPFVEAVEKGVDIALNFYPLPWTKRYQHPTAIAKHAVNLFSGRFDLAACSLTAVPHALSKRVVEGMGPHVFAVPPVAQVTATLAGSYRIEPVARVPVGKLNPKRSRHHQIQMKELIIGDCLEAIHVIHGAKGLRGGFTDLNRKRYVIPYTNEITDVIGGEQPVHTLAIIPTQGEENLPYIVASTAKAEVAQTLIIENGMKQSVAHMYENESFNRVSVLNFEDALGHDVGRAIGCGIQKANIYLFMDSDIRIRADDIKRFIDGLENVDVALNNLDAVLPLQKQVDAPSIVKRFLNLVCGRPDLGVASLTAIPNAMKGDVIETIGREVLAVPPLAQVKAILAGFRVEAVHSVDVISRNTYRPELHSRESGRPIAKLIIGDYLEALYYLQSQKGVRVNFPDTMRRRDVLED